MSWSTWPGFRAGHRWEQANLPSSPDDDAPRQEWRRPLGLLELKFDLSTQRAGQSDTFLRLSVSLEPAAGEAAAKEAQNAFLSRMLLAWTLARARHPLLAATVHDSAEAHSIPSVQAREFRYRPPTTAEEAIDEARETVLVHEGEGTVEEAMDEVQSRYILNGERVLLDQGRCLARLVLVRSEKSPERLGFFLVISHIISDGLSVFKLVNELFSLTSSPSLPTPSPPPTFRSLADYLSSAPTPLPPYEVPNEALSAWPLVLPPETLLSRLPLPNEEHYPVIPLPPSASPPVPPPASATELPSAPPSPPPSAPPSPQPSPARARWFWAFHRVLLTQRAERFPRTLFMPRLAYPEKPPQARTRWPQLRFSKETSAMLLTLCKREGVSPSMLLYSLISLSISRILAAEHPSAPYHPVIIGFPFSFRPFLLPSPPSAPPSSSGAAPTHSNPSSDLAIRITFWQIHLPSLPLDPNDPSAEKELRAAVMRGAKLAKRQFAERLAPEPEKRSAFIAEAYSLVLQRNGVGNNPIPYDEPKTALNASMIGDVDRLLPTAFPLPPPAVSSSSSSSPSSGQLRLSNLLIGTRLHNGEGLLLEALTWDGQITLCLGVDDGLVSSEVVERLLEGVREAGEVVARGEGAS